MNAGIWMEPCPFCGSESPMLTQNYGLYYVKCHDCGATGPVYKEDEYTGLYEADKADLNEMALHAWNSKSESDRSDITEENTLSIRERQLYKKIIDNAYEIGMYRGVLEGLHNFVIIDVDTKKKVKETLDQFKDKEW